jgi:hypothetical protein
MFIDLLNDFDSASQVRMCTVVENPFLCFFFFGSMIYNVVLKPSPQELVTNTTSCTMTNYAHPPPLIRLPNFKRN